MQRGEIPRYEVGGKASSRGTDLRAGQCHPMSASATTPAAAATNAHAHLKPSPAASTVTALKLPTSAQGTSQRHNL